MNQLCKKWISLLVAVVLLAAFIPAVPVQAAGASLSISSLYTGTDYDDPTNLKPDDDTKVGRVTSNPIQVKANYFNITDSDLTNVYYEVTNATSGVVTAEKSDKAVQTGSNEITFQSVDLTEGLNKVVLKYGSGSTTVDSEIGWVYYTPTTTITNLKIGEEQVKDNGFYPSTYNSSNTAVIISGKATNASIVGAYNMGMDSYEKNSYPDNDGLFYLIGDESVDQKYADSPGVLALRGGDNYIRFEARNSSNTYKLEKNIIYNNGKPFPFQTMLYPLGGSSGTDYLMARQLTATTDQLTLSTKLKVNKNSNGLEYNNISLTLNNLLLLKYDLQTLTLDSSSTSSNISSPVLTLDSNLNSEYNIYDLSFNIEGITNAESKNSLAFVFGSVTVPSSSSFNFAYENSNNPLVVSVARSNGTILSEDVTNDISTLPEELIVTTSNASGVHFYIDDVLQSTKTVSSDKAEFTISNLSEGTHTFNFQPYDSSGPYSAGRKVYTIQVTSTPYIIPQNVYSGRILDGDAAISAFQSQGLLGTVQNYDESGNGNSLKAYVNGVKIADSLSGSFTLTSGSFTLPIPATEKLIEGKNSIKFEIYYNGSLIRTQIYEIYAFTKKTPYFENLLPVGAGSTFVLAQTSDKYATKASKVAFSGTVYNATSLKVTKYYKDANGMDQATVLSAAEVGFSSGSGTIASSEIVLPTYNSDVRFEFVASNDFNLTATTSITIVREPTPYNIKKPALFTNPKGVSQANINSNFVEVIIEADNADSVLVGKETATLLDPNENGGLYLYKYTVKDLKAGSNTIKFSVVRSTETVSGSFIVYNANTNQPGAASLVTMSTKMSAFNSSVSLTFPKGTVLKRTEPDVNNSSESYLTATRRVLFGIANSSTGKVDLTASTGFESLAKSRLANTSAVNRFSAASQLFWIDGGVIPNSPVTSDQDDIDAHRQNALTGNGLDPYDSSTTLFTQSRVYGQQVIPTNLGELTLKFDPNVKYEAWRYITVFRFTVEKSPTGTQSIGWTNIGGVVDMSKNTITVPFEKFGYYQVMYMDRSYDDVTTHSYARDGLDILFSKGVMNGKSDYTFSTTESITRAEFAEALVKVFEIPLNYDEYPTFDDVPISYKTTLAEYKYIETAARAGIIRGTSMNRFDPNKSILREDASIMIARAAELKLESDLSKAAAALVKAFTDGANVSTYAGPSVLAITKAGLIEGIPNVLTEGQTKETVRFEPGQNLSRADAGLILIRVMKNQKKLPK
ncbi:S-layer homology domain-containing protein [Paenibacillus sp. YN15]|uniref:S-layer homology domain-containing protein n=1 Tax=Paenibacillus sp. YN15 TaxID=1742774 RepID=UPI0015EB8290|nr:S-layer homology domain-containing protein [Paenibacillus sp. YN15]